MTVDNIMRLVGRCYQIEKKQKELEEKLNSLQNHFREMMRIEGINRERLDKLEVLVNARGAFFRGVEERLDKLEDYQSKQDESWNDERKRLDKLEKALEDHYHYADDGDGKKTGVSFYILGGEAEA